MLAEKLVRSFASAPPMLPLNPRDCSGPFVETMGLRAIIEASRKVKLTPPRIGPMPGCVMTSTNVVPGFADSAAN